MQSAQKSIAGLNNSVTPDPGDPAAQLALTQAKLAASEARAADAEEMLADALQSSLAWLWESDSNYRFTRVIGAIQLILGTPPDKLIGKPIEDLSRKSDDPRIQLYIDAIKAKKPYRDVILPLNTRLGRRWIKASGKARFDLDGNFLGYRGIASDVTAQVETERKAAEAQRRFMEAIENVPASLMLCDAEDRIVFCNSATQRYFPTAAHLLVPGTKYEELLRAHAASGYVQGIGEDFETWIAERMKWHRSGTTNLTRAYQDGRWSKIVERRTSDGGIIGIRLDITELKKREQELEKLSSVLSAGKGHLALAQRASRVGSAERDLKTGAVTWSDECNRLFDRDPSLPPPQRREFLNLVHPEDRAIYEASMIASEKGERAEPIEYRVIHGDGTVRWLHSEAMVELDAEGKPAKRIITYKDVTEVHNAQAALKAMAESLQHSQDHLTRAQRLAHVGSDDRNMVTDEATWSDTTYDIFGVDKQTFQPTTENFLKLVHPDDRHVIARTRGEIAAGKNPKPFEYRIIRPDGAVRTIYREVHVSVDELGNPMRMIGTIRDVTEQRAAEEQIRLKSAELAARAEELQRSNAELEQFAYVASHDLQEPLRMVASYCQMLQRRYKDKLDRDANEFIGYAVEGAGRMQRLINDLLAYSRVGRQGGDPAPLEFADLVKSALANLEAAIAESGVRIDVAEMPRVTGVRLQLTQLLQNIIGNAIKFRRDGVVPHISISAAPDGAMWRFTVEDNGIGIDKEYLDRVFLIFQRLHERNKYPGTGIGLAIAKKVIEHHGGRIWIESTPGQGSRFNFTLPSA